MKKLNIKSIVTRSGDSMKVTKLGQESFAIPEYAVILGDGLCVETGMGLHLFGFAAAATIHLAENHKGELPIEIYGCSTGEELFTTLEKLIDEEGVVSEANSTPFTSLYLLTSTFDKVRASDTWPELDGLIKNTTFINSKYNATESTEFSKDFAEKWIQKYSDLIWAVRVLGHMYTDEEFWDENDKSLWNELMKARVGVRLPSIQKIKANLAHNAYRNRYVLPGIIEDLMPKNLKDDMVLVMDSYATVREMYGAEGWYGSLWLENFFEGDLDDLVFIEPSNEGESIAKVKEIEALTTGTITIKDAYMDFTLVLPREAIVSISYSKSSDEGYLDFIAPEDIVLKRLYKKGELITAFSIDEYSTVTINTQ